MFSSGLPLPPPPWFGPGLPLASGASSAPFPVSTLPLRGEPTVLTTRPQVAVNHRSDVLSGSMIAYP